MHGEARLGGAIRRGGERSAPHRGASQEARAAHVAVRLRDNGKVLVAGREWRCPPRPQSSYDPVTHALSVVGTEPAAHGAGGDLPSAPASSSGEALMPMALRSRRRGLYYPTLRSDEPDYARRARQ